MPHQSEIYRLNDLANEALRLWELPSDAKARLINLSENATYLVTGGAKFKAILRLHREDYNSRRAIESELAWMDALRRDADVETPRYYLGRNGVALQSHGTKELPRERFLVLFHFIEGQAPEVNGDMMRLFEGLGAMAAKCHVHAVSWERPASFERRNWDLNAVFGANAPWGDWRDAPEVTPKVCEVLEGVEEAVRARLCSYGKAPDRFNLIHADMRLANLLVNETRTGLIDFDDCGFGWLMYDFASANSFIEDDPRVPDLRSAWVNGYRTIRSLADEDEAEIGTFIMLRRMALLSWIGSRRDAPEPKALAPGFARATARLGERWLCGEALA